MTMNLESAGERNDAARDATIHRRARPSVPRSARAWVWLTALAVAVGCVAVPLLAGLHQSTTLKLALQLLKLRGFGRDSWDPMGTALHQLQTHPHASVYQVVFFDEHVKFQYPLTSLLPLDLVQAIVGAAHAAAVMNGLSCLAFLGTGAVSGLIWLRTTAGSGGTPSRRTVTVHVLLGIVSAALFYPLTTGLWLGQIQTSITFVVAAAILAWQSERRGLAGILLALCCLIKPQWAVILVWALLRRQWRFLTGAVATGALGSALAVALYGWNNVVGYLDVLSYISRRGESFYTNQSVNGLMNRLLFNGRDLTIDLHSFPPPNDAVYAATMISSILLIALVLLWRLRRTPTVVDLCLVIATLTIASPIAWDQHYGPFLPIFAVLVPLAWSTSRTGIKITVGCAYVLVSQSLTPVTNHLAGSHWNVLQSTILLGGLLTLGALYRTTVRPRAGAC